MTQPPSTPPPRRPLSYFALALLVGGVIALLMGAGTLFQAQGLAQRGQVLPAVVTKVGDRQGRFVPVTYRFDYTAPDGQRRTMELTDSSHHSRVEKWTAGREVEVLVDVANPSRAHLAENQVSFATGLQWVFFGLLATVFGAFRLRRPA